MRTLNVVHSLRQASSIVVMGKKRPKQRPGRPRKRKFQGNQFASLGKSRSEDESSYSSSYETDSSSDERVCTRTVTKLVAHNDGSVYGGVTSESNPEESDVDDMESGSDDSSSESSGDGASDGESASSGYRFVDLKQLQLLLANAASCKVCCGDLVLEEVKREGLASTVQLTCMNCRQKTAKTLANKCGQFWDINRRAVFGMRWIGCGRQGLVKFCAAVNMPSPMTHSAFDGHVNALRTATVEVARQSMAAAAEAVHRQVDAELDTTVDTAVTFDGTWMRRGHTSLYGVFTVMSWDIGKVLDLHVASKYCQQCAVWKSRKREGKVTNAEFEQFIADHSCTRTTAASSGGMEAEAAPILWRRSEERRLRYTTFIGDGDSKSFIAVQNASPYGPHVKIEKEECVGHVQKRVGTNLRKLKKNFAGKKLEAGGTIGGRGRLTDAMIESLQTYYGLAVRANIGDLQAMCRAIWASLMHRVSTDELPKHQYCPPGIESWCGWQRQQAGGDAYQHHNILPQAIFKVAKPLYIRLTDKALLQRCLRGATQNQNECFNGLVWQLCPKTSFCGARAVEMAAAFATAWFNDGAVAVQHILQEMSLDTGVFTASALVSLDRSRAYHAERKVSNAAKQGRKRSRRIRKGLQEEELAAEGVQYEAGEFWVTVLTLNQ